MVRYLTAIAKNCQLQSLSERRRVLWREGMERTTVADVNEPNLAAGPRPENAPANRALVERCLAGDSTAWEQLVGRFAALVRSVAVRHGLTAVEVDDVGQEVFLTLAQNLHRIEDPEALPAWLMTTARRFSWRVWQRRRREIPADDEALEAATVGGSWGAAGAHMPSMAELLHGWALQEMLGAAMQNLTPRCRELLALLFLDETEPGYDEVGARLNIPKGSIGPTRSRCLEQLRMQLEGLGLDAHVGSAGD